MSHQVTHHRQRHVLEEMGLAGCSQGLVDAPCPKEQSGPERRRRIRPNGGHVIYFSPVNFYHCQFTGFFIPGEAANLKTC
jgi:hypothetical protein